nr:DDE-type integrase/transposase/recombinase [Mycolicibacterium pyrenivorans]
MPPIEADAPKVVWAIDFQFDSTIDGKAIKIASMIDEHTSEALLNLVERSITGEHLVAELTKVFAANGGPPKVLRLDNGPEMVSQAPATVLREQDRDGVHPAGLPMGQRLHRIVQQPATQGVSEPQLLEHSVRGPRGVDDFKEDHNRRHRHSALGYRTPAEYAAACRCTHTPVACSIN